MLTIKTVLAPVDFSDRSEMQVETAENIASHFGAQIVLAHVIPMFGFLHPADPTAAKAYQLKFESEIRDGVEQALSEMAGRMSSGEKMETVVRSGDPGDEIAKLAEELRADLVVLPTAGQGRFRQSTLGSVTTKALHDVACPVMTGVHLERVEARAVHPYRKVGWLATLQAGDERVLAWARDFAAAYDAELCAMHALACPESGMPEGWAEARTERARSKMESLLEDAGVEANIRVAHGETAFRELVKATRVDVIVTSRRRTDAVLGLSGLHGAVTETVRLSPRPVISV